MTKKHCPTLHVTANMTFVGTANVNKQREGLYECHLCRSHHTATQILRDKKRMSAN